MFGGQKATDRQLDLFFHPVGPGHWTQVVRLGGKQLCPLNHLAGLHSV